MINIEQFDHVGIRITDRERSVKYYEFLGFKIEVEVDFDAVIVMKNASGVEINLVVNGVDLNQGKNILMDVPEKHTGFTHVALRVESIIETLKTLEENNIVISQGPVSFGHKINFNTAGVLHDDHSIKVNFNFNFKTQELIILNRPFSICNTNTHMIKLFNVYHFISILTKFS
jgi:lactoylglutathione lyase